MAAASGGMLRQGGLDHIPSNIKNMSGGGIIAFANGTEDEVIDSSRLVGQNNPFNIRDYDQGWEGQTGSTEGFVDFDSLYSGIRAADKLIDNLLENKKNKDSKLFKNDFKLNLNIREVYLDSKNIINNLIGAAHLLLLNIENVTSGIVT